MTNLSLAEKLEGLTGPCRETDALIARALGWTTVAPPRDSDRPLPHLWVAPDGSQHMAFPPHWTGCLTSVVALVEKELPGWAWKCIKSVPGPWKPYAEVWAGGVGVFSSNANTPALALLAAFLRARAAFLRAKEADHG